MSAALLAGILRTRLVPVVEKQLEDLVAQERNPTATRLAIDRNNPLTDPGQVQAPASSRLGVVSTRTRF